ncbi:Uncharacterized protein BN964_00893 [Leuconostoc citreum]|nr:Uncharacterized protein BN964_00893 [Leuconostoc citreum]
MIFASMMTIFVIVQQTLRGLHLINQLQKNI